MFCFVSEAVLLFRHTPWLGKILPKNVFFSIAKSQKEIKDIPKQKRNRRITRRKY